MLRASEGRNAGTTLSPTQGNKVRTGARSNDCRSSIWGISQKSRPTFSNLFPRGLVHARLICRTSQAGGCTPNPYGVTGVHATQARRAPRLAPLRALSAHRCPSERLCVPWVPPSPRATSAGDDGARPRSARAGSAPVRHDAATAAKAVGKPLPPPVQLGAVPSPAQPPMVKMANYAAKKARKDEEATAKKASRLLAWVAAAC